MSPPKREHTAVTVAVVLIGAILAVAATAASGMPTSTSSAAATTYTDRAGDSQGGPDVTRVVIDGDPAVGRIRVAVTVLGYLPASPEGLERYVDVWLDTDKNENTGDPDDGTEYSLDAWNDSTGEWGEMGRWNGSKWEPIPESPTWSFSRSGDVLSWTFKTSDVGGARSFDFYVGAGLWNTVTGKDMAQDFAPDGDYWWDYSLAAIKPVIGRPVTVAAPIAGKRFTVVFPVTRSDDGTALLSATVGCKTTVAGRTVPHVHAFKSGAIKAALLVPKGAKGKQLKVVVNVKAGTQTATKVFTFKID